MVTWLTVGLPLLVLHLQSLMSALLGSHQSPLSSQKLEINALIFYLVRYKELLRISCSELQVCLAHFLVQCGFWKIYVACRKLIHGNLSMGSFFFLKTST